MKRITGSRFVILCISLLFIGAPNSSKSEPFENDVGSYFDMKKYVDNIDLIQGESKIITLVNNHDAANVDFIVPDIGSNKVEFSNVGSDLAEIAIPLNSCGCRGSPIYNIRKKE